MQSATPTVIAPPTIERPTDAAVILPARRGAHIDVMAAVRYE